MLVHTVPTAQGIIDHVIDQVSRFASGRPPPTVGLTKQQSRAFAFIEAYVGQNGYAPSYTEISRALDLKSKSSAYRLVHALEARGAIRRGGSLARAITVIDPAAQERERCAEIAVRMGRPDIAAAIREAN